MEYKGYTATVTFDDEACIFHGEVVDTRDVITFQGGVASELTQAFHDSVDIYLEFCAERDEEPDKPFSGILNLRLGRELHRSVFVSATSAGMSINTWLTEAIRRETEKEDVV